jgi:putative phosphoesterase
VRIAVLSDVHGNRLALEAVLDDIAEMGADLTVNLGDLVSGPMEPHWTADILIDADFPTVRGNHDRLLVTRSPYGLGKVDRYVAGQLEKRHFDWMAGLPATLAIERQLYLCHGTPRNDEAPWLDAWWSGRSTQLPDEAMVAAEAEGIDFPVILCGHTHIARAVRLRDGRLIVNPGSVGVQMVHGLPDARYALIEEKPAGWSVTFRSVPYDFGAAARMATANGFGHWSGALTTGWSAPEGLF